jgi:predicted nucleic acid-binding protein
MSRGLRPGKAFELGFDPEEGRTGVRRPSRDKDWLAVLEQCPVPMADLPLRRREVFEQQRQLDAAANRCPMEDSCIAIIARPHGLTGATGNERYFRRSGLNVFNCSREGEI